jgi:hypothetical protein
MSRPAGGTYIVRAVAQGAQGKNTAFLNSEGDAQGARGRARRSNYAPDAAKRLPELGRLE